ncbi:Na+/H+ antiporter subunit G [Lysobacter sp. N42]|uniref:Na+/H+ antiporter subunit G n=1 Tax=Lysobacter sp. N42 TaxID=2545719 RepID=UPI001049DD42|nr:Na+/H+ antiporter subunit G [Lysobacter sp. N42]TCZ84000.1 Na+/H+ antiporter subunit G [Lysobacter sp. N42]
MALAVELFVVALIAVGTFFVFVGSLGLVKLSEFFRRLHGPTKATTLGVGCILIASIADHALRGEGFGFRELLVTVFLFITAPISAHLVSRAALRLAPEQRPPVPAARDASVTPAPAPGTAERSP